jgi:hypothetical protein
VCVGLFSETDHALIVATGTLETGDFILKNPPPGDYRLVATYPAFGTANARVRVGSGAKGVILRMRPVGIDTTSTVERR